MEDIDEQNQRINQIISYQLTRAVGQSAAPFRKAILIRPIAEKVVIVIAKVYADKNVCVNLDIPDDAKFRMDQGDLMGCWAISSITLLSMENSKSALK